jgi:hypothetical protein
VEREERLVAELQRVGREVGRTPTQAAMVGYGNYPPEGYRKVFGSWEDALREAGFDPAALEQERYDTVDSISLATTLRDLVTNGSDEDRMKAKLLAELQRLAADLDQTPSRTRMEKYGRYSPKMYETHFGSWTKALRAVGLDPVENTPGVTDAELLADLRRLTSELGRRPTVSDVRTLGKYSVKTYYDHFDSYIDACERAGIMRRPSRR